MLAIDITDLKTFASLLFAGTGFDGFVFREADFSTSVSFHIDGHIHEEYYDTGELETMRSRDFLLWKDIRPFCLSIIKGRRLPVSFRIILQLPPDHPLCGTSPALQKEAEEEHLFLNIQYKNKKLSCSTGASQKVFRLGQKPGEVWDEQLASFLHSLGIT